MRKDLIAARDYQRRQGNRDATALEQLARVRYEEGLTLGLAVNPENDDGRYLVDETRHALANSYNYALWAALRASGAHLCEETADLLFYEFSRALHWAWELLDGLEKKRGK